MTESRIGKITVGLACLVVAAGITFPLVTDASLGASVFFAVLGVALVGIWALA